MVRAKTLASWMSVKAKQLRFKKGWEQFGDSVPQTSAPVVSVEAKVKSESPILDF